VGQITDPKKFHPQCRPEEVFDPKSGSCIPVTNIEGAEPRGTLECPPGFVLDKKLKLCVPESPTSQAQQKLSPKVERCVLEVKKSLRKKRPKMKDKDLKSSAIAICRSRIGE